MELTPVGPDAVLVALDDVHGPDVHWPDVHWPDVHWPADLAAWARERGLAREVVPGAETVLLDGLADSAALPGLLRTWSPGELAESPQPVTIPVTYDGEDLSTVADLLGESIEAVVRRHRETAWTSRFCGFAPGFAYLAGWDLRVPRLATPRTKVPPGSVALADGWCGIYPVPSPGGWQLIGRTDVRLWDPDRDQPALLAPGTPVRFVETA
jgi:KipI family sensor histidine kinase inhibitor